MTSDWRESRNAIPKALPSEGLRTPQVTPETTEPGVIPLDCLIGPAELKALAGVPKGSVAYMMREHAMPAPVLQLTGIRLWDRRAIIAWQSQRTSTAGPATSED